MDISHDIDQSKLVDAMQIFSAFERQNIDFIKTFERDCLRAKQFLEAYYSGA